MSCRVLGYMECVLAPCLHKDVTHVNFALRHTRMSAMKLVIQHCPKLNSVCLNGRRAESCMRRLCQHYGKQLQTVELSHTEAPIDALAKYSPNVTRLILCDCYIPEDGIAKIGQCFTQLQSLTLRWSDVKNVRPLRQCRKLKELLVSEVSNVPPEAWAAVLRQLPLLERLMLDGVNVPLETIVGAASHHLKFFSTDQKFDVDCARHASRQWSQLETLFAEIDPDARFEFRRCARLDMASWRHRFQDAQQMCQTCRALAQSQVLRQRFGPGVDVVIVGYLGRFAAEDYAQTRVHTESECRHTRGK